MHKDGQLIVLSFLLAFASGMLTGSAMNEKPSREQGYQRCLMDIQQEGLPFIQKKWEFDHRSTP